MNQNDIVDLEIKYKNDPQVLKLIEIIKNRAHENWREQYITLENKIALHNRRVRQLTELTDIQTSKGNFDVNEYMRGLANGLILALATMKGEEPLFIEPVKNASES